MNIIFCEGKTDAILISYFLNKVYSYQHFNQKKIHLPIENDNEFIAWYENPKKNSPEIAIWAVGGYDNLGKRINTIIEWNSIPQNNSNFFDKIIVYFDRDDNNDKKLVTDIENWLFKVEYNKMIKLNEWKVISIIQQYITPPNKINSNFLAIPIPPESDGALETFLLDNLATNGNSGDSFIINESRKYIKLVPDEPYLKNTRLREKAALGTVLSTFEPNNTFKKIDERLMSVKWEDFIDINSIFKELSAITI